MRSRFFVEALARLVHFRGLGAHSASNGARKHMRVDEGGLRMTVRRGFPTRWIVHDENDQVLYWDVWDRTLENQFYRLKLVRVSSRRSSQRQAKYGAEQRDCREGWHRRTHMPKKFELSSSSRSGGSFKALSEKSSDDFVQI